MLAVCVELRVRAEDVLDAAAGGDDDATALEIIRGYIRRAVTTWETRPEKRPADKSQVVKNTAPMMGRVNIPDTNTARKCQ
jgi:hypothetical protein